MSKYTPLHVHSDFSIGDSILSIEEYVNFAKANGFGAIAITDHGSMSASFNLNSGCKAAGIKSILGIEAYCMTKEEFADKTNHSRQHLVLLAKNLNGYKNLLKIHGLALRDTFYYRPIIMYEDLFENKQDIIVLSGCTAGRIPQAIISGDEDKAIKFTAKMKTEFGDDFYLEVMENDIEDQKKFNDWVKANYKEFGVKVAFTTDSHYLKKEHNLVHDIHRLNSFKGTYEDPDVLNKIYKSRNLWVKTYDEIISEATTKGYDINFIKESLATTMEIAAKCEDYTIINKETVMPKFSDDSWNDLCNRVIAGMEKKKLQGEVYYERLRHEMEVIKFKKMEDYFLIIADMVEFSEKNDIFVGVGRGSAAGSLVSYLLNITKLDPIKYGLLFQRFLNVARLDPPDIDMDFDSKNRHLIEVYLKQKYGIDSVAHIVSFGRYGIKGALRDTFKVHFNGKHKADIDMFTTNIRDDEDDFDKGVEKAIGLAGKKAQDFYQLQKDKFDMAKVLVGKNRHLSLHAAGIVIVPGKLDEHIPLLRTKDEIVAGFQEGADIRTISESGLMKFDILGLNACCIIKDALKLLVGKTTLDDIIKDDNNAEVLAEFARGNTFGSFQFEGKRITSFTKKVKPTRFDDLVAINALYRPAVIQAGGLDLYLDNKSKYVSSGDKLDEILAETYGVMVYQEQILEIFHKLGGFTLEEADLGRHTLKLLFKGKEDYSEFDIMMKKFKEGCHKNTDYSDEKIMDILEKVKKFSEYSFNKSHSCSYAMMGYIMMYLKKFWPTEFFASLLNNTENSDSLQDKREVNLLRNYISQIHNSSRTKVLPPNINDSDANEFKILNGNLMYPLSKIKNIGEEAAAEIVAHRPYGSLKDVLANASKLLNKRVIKAIVCSGAAHQFLDLQEEYKKRFKEEIELFNKIKNVYDYTSLIWEDEFYRNMGYGIRIRDAKRTTSCNNLLLYGMVTSKSVKKAKSSGRINTWVSIYDGSDFLDNCMWFGKADINEGDIVKTFVTQSEPNAKFETRLYFLKGAKI